MVKLSEVQKSAEEFLHCLDFSIMSYFVTPGPKSKNVLVGDNSIS